MRLETGLENGERHSGNEEGKTGSISQVMRSNIPPSNMGIVFMKNSLEATWSASKTQMSSEPGTRVPGGYSWEHTLLMLPDLPFISPALFIYSLKTHAMQALKSSWMCKQMNACILLPINTHRNESYNVANMMHSKTKKGQTQDSMSVLLLLEIYSA